MLANHLSVRSYSEQSRNHFHKYHQLVMPLHGTIVIKVGSFDGLASLGDCVIIKAEQQHHFKANENARFIVLDSTHLPKNVLNSTAIKVSIDKPLISFLQFIEIQLNQQVNSLLEETTLDLFYQLLAQQSFLHKIDKRIEKALSIIQDDISKPHAISTLAKQAFLSSTQFKKVFKESTGMSCKSYITTLRMEKAKALLMHTDTPINLIAEKCGYQNHSSFTRKFKTYFGDAPNSFCR